MGETKANKHYNFKSNFATMREIQDFEQKNISMSSPNLDSTTIVKNTTNRKMSPIDSITVGTKTLKPTQLICPTDFLEQNGKVHVPHETLEFW